MEMLTKNRVDINSYINCGRSTAYKFAKIV